LGAVGADDRFFWKKREKCTDVGIGRTLYTMKFITGIAAEYD